jgi:hypothetical protein
VTSAAYVRAIVVVHLSLLGRENQRAMHSARTRTPVFITPFILTHKMPVGAAGLPASTGQQSGFGS